MVSSRDPAHILLFGANGQVGHELKRTLEPLGSVVALVRTDADFSKPESLREVVRRIKPIMLVNAAAYTAVDKAESEPELALAINATSPAVLAEESEALDACLVQYSTDFVFDGSQDSPYTENCETNPLSEYGRSKLAGDLAVIGLCRRHLIIRTSWVFGSHGTNFLKTILRLASERSSLSIVADQFGAPTSSALIAQTTAAILSVMASGPAGDKRWGVYHLAPTGRTSWYEYAKYVVGQAREKGMRLNLSANNILAITTAEYPLPAARPAYSVLDTKKLRETFGLTLPCWKSDVDKVLDRLMSK